MLSLADGPAPAIASILASTLICMRSISLEHGPAWLGRIGRKSAAALSNSILDAHDLTSLGTVEFKDWIADDFDPRVVDVKSLAEQVATQRPSVRAGHDRGTHLDGHRGSTIVISTTALPTPRTRP